MKSKLKCALRACPWLYWRLKLWNHQRTTKHEIELRLVPALARPDLDSIDIGASGGTYTLALLPYSNRILSFEPRKDGVRELIEMTQVLHLPIQVETIALSNREGKVEMRMLLRDLGRSTIAPENVLFDPDKSPEQRVLVTKKTLDSYGLSGVGFIKIDVEGHEKAVLEGAAHTIEKSRCNLLIEMEERHCPGVISQVRTWLRARRYAGFFVEGREILAIEMFNYAAHQDPKNIGGWRENWSRRGIYINNFIFVPEETKEEFLRKAKALDFSSRVPMNNNSAF